MLRHLFITALRDLARSPLQSLIALGGLSIGLCAAILAGLVIVNQTSYDHFLPGYERIYLATVKGTLGGRPPDYFPYTPHDVGARLRQDFPEIEAVSRFKSDTSSLRHGDIEASETLYNAEPNIFALLPLPLLYGNLDTAGRLFNPAKADVVLTTSPRPPLHYVINQTAVRDLGFADAASAIGHELRFASDTQGNAAGPSSMNGAIVGVIQDFSLNPEFAAQASGGKRMVGAAFAVDMNRPGVSPPPVELYVKLDGHDVPETLAAIDTIWKERSSDPINRRFLDVYIQSMLGTVQKEGRAFALFAGIAMVLACLGLFGVSLFTAARRTKEIGVRKAMGATSADIVLLLLWQFAKPVLWANAIAWPLAWWAMQRWLSGFVFHISLPLWIFPAASAAALAIAVLTVAGQAILVALQKPVLALRYE